MVFGLVFFVANVKAESSLGGYEVENYEVEIVVNEDSSFEVEERISVNFLEPRHGIYRFIPIKYKDDNKFQHNFRFTLISVEDGDGNEHNVAEKGKQDGDYMIKIGNPNVTFEGQEEYVIKYEVQNGFRFFNDHSELFWNPIGTQWDVPIKNASVRIFAPEGVDFRNYEQNFVCYTGSFGSKEQDCTGGFIGTSELLISADRTLGAGEGLTVAVKFLPEDIKESSFMTMLLWFLVDNFGFLLPIIVLIVMYLLWLKKGKEINLKKTVIVQYDAPDDLTPGEMGYLLKEKYNSKMIAADIIDLAVKGYVEIIESKKTFGKKYEIKKKKKDIEENLTEHQKEIILSLFSGRDGVVDLSKKNNDLYAMVTRLQKKIKKQIKARGYFYGGIWNKKSFYLGTITPLLFFAVLFGGSFKRVDIIIGLFISGFFIIIFGIFMSKKTKEGAEASWHAKGFREYVNTAERYRVKFQEEEDLFEKFLPYAMVFGLADKWSKAFDGILKENPNWYHGSGGVNTFSPASFGSFANGFSSQTNSSFTPPSSSSSGFSGGGSSGGGGGGGGGGSW